MISLKTQHYPSGASLSFEDEYLKKLNIADVEVGDMVSIDAVGRITNITTHERDKEKGHKTVDIQIEKIEISTDEEKKMRKETAKEVWK